MHQLMSHFLFTSSPCRIVLGRDTSLPCPHYPSALRSFHHGQRNRRAVYSGARSRKVVEECLERSEVVRRPARRRRTDSPAPCGRVYTLFIKMSTYNTVSSPAGSPTNKRAGREDNPNPAPNDAPRPASRV